MKGADFSYIPIITRKMSARLPLSDIVMIRRDSRRVDFYTDDGAERYQMYARMDEIRSYLDDRFYPCLAGCIINFSKVRSMKDQCVIFDDGRKLYLGRDAFIRARQEFNSFLRKRKAKNGGDGAER